MSKHKIGKIFLTDSKLPLPVILKINDTWLKGGLFDLFSWPYLTNTILFNSGKKHPLHNYLSYEIEELADMHNTKQIIAFVSMLEGYPKEIESGLKNRFPGQEIKIVKYFTKNDTIEANFEGETEVFSNEIIPEMFLLCSDGRLIKIIYEYYKEKLGREFNFHHACQPGTSIWMTLSPRSKEMKNSIKLYTDRYQIGSLANIHHGKDCGRFLQYYCIGGDVNPERALKQHEKDMLRTCLKFERMNHKYRGHRPKNIINVISMYFEFDEKNNMLRIHVYGLTKNDKLELERISLTEYSFDFRIYKFINDKKKNEDTISLEEKTQVLI